MTIPAIFGVDTSQITKVIREHGNLLAQMACASKCSSLEHEKKTLAEKLASDEDWKDKPLKCVMEIVV